MSNDLRHLTEWVSALRAPQAVTAIQELRASALQFTKALTEVQQEWQATCDAIHEVSSWATQIKELRSSLSGFQLSEFRLAHAEMRSWKRWSASILLPKRTSQKYWLAKTKTEATGAVARFNAEKLESQPRDSVGAIAVYSSLLPEATVSRATANATVSALQRFRALWRKTILQRVARPVSGKVRPVQSVGWLGARLQRLAAKAISPVLQKDSIKTGDVAVLRGLLSRTAVPANNYVRPCVVSHECASAVTHQHFSTEADEESGVLNQLPTLSRNPMWSIIYGRQHRTWRRQNASCY